MRVLNEIFRFYRANRESGEAEFETLHLDWSSVRPFYCRFRNQKLQIPRVKCNLPAEQNASIAHIPFRGDKYLSLHLNDRRYKYALLRARGGG